VTLDDLSPAEVDLVETACSWRDRPDRWAEHLAAHAPGLAARLLALHPEDVHALHQYLLDRQAGAAAAVLSV
jgi:hypothetical protein